MTAYTLEFSCPRCGGEMIPAESTIVSPDHTQHEARCDHCCDLYRVDLVATVIEPWPVDLIDPDARLARARRNAAEGAFPMTSLKGASG